MYVHTQRTCLIMPDYTELCIVMERNFSSTRGYKGEEEVGREVCTRGGKLLRKL